MPRGPVRSSRGRSPRRKRIWTRTPGILLTAGAATPQHVDLLAGASVIQGAQFTGSTVARVRINAFVRQPTGAGVSSSGFIGVQVGHRTLEAVDHDPANTAEGQAHQDWMSWGRYFAPIASVTGVLAVYEIDVKSMRVIEEIGQTLWLCWGTVDAADVELTAAASVLLMLP